MPKSSNNVIKLDANLLASLNGSRQIVIQTVFYPKPSAEYASTLAVKFEGKTVRIKQSGKVGIFSGDYDADFLNSV